MRPPRADRTRACCKMRNSQLGSLGNHLSTRVWRTAETKPKTPRRSDASAWDFLRWKLAQPPHFPSLKGNQNLARISETQCKSPFAPFYPKIKINNGRETHLHLIILIMKRSLVLNYDFQKKIILRSGILADKSSSVQLETD